MSKMIHTILFNGNIKFDNQLGASFYNATTEMFAILSYSEATKPAKLIHYHVHWAKDPQPGEHIEWRYDGFGNYASDTQIPMRPQQLSMVNCADFECNTESAKAS